MIVLPSPRRAHLRAFCLVQGALAAIVTMIVAGLLGGRQYLGIAIVPAGLLAVVGLWYPKAAESFYAAWSRAAERYAKVARDMVLKICYCIVFALVGRVGSGIQRTRVRESLWAARSTNLPEEYASQYDAAPRGSLRSWPFTYLNWTRRSGNFGAAGLLPFLMLIAALDTEKSSAYPVAIYTLF